MAAVRITFTVKEGFNGERFFKALNESKLWQMLPEDMAKLNCVKNDRKVTLFQLLP
jgi:hypothetical protein